MSNAANFSLQLPHLSDKFCCLLFGGFGRRAAALSSGVRSFAEKSKHLMFAQWIFEHKKGKFMCPESEFYHEI
jgi:hypothetical protein